VGVLKSVEKGAYAALGAGNVIVDDADLQRVGAAVFLNGEGEDGDPDAYGGGSLTFYGLLGEDEERQVGLPLMGEEGLLVAFASDLPHAVTPVTHGERYTVVTWLV
jgi:SM-20-related protein